MAFATYGKGGKPPKSYQKNNEGKDLGREYSYEEAWDALFNSKDSPIPQTLTKAHRIVVVDADAIVYRISAACEKRTVVAKIDGKEEVFRTKTKLKKHCEEVGVDFNTVEFDNELFVEPVNNAYETLRKTVAKIYRELNATHVIFFLGGSVNFRSGIKLPTQYKSNRKTTRRPEHLPAVREYLNKNYDTFIVTGIEADDIVQGMSEYIINRKRAYACAYQLDKDFHTTMTRNRYWHIDKKEIIELRGGIGELLDLSSGIRGDGLHWVLYQLMQGDDSDGYSPKVLYKDKYKGRYGGKSYYKDFSTYGDEKELLVAWIDKWQELLPETIKFEDFNGETQKHNWLTLAEIYFQCLYMRMSPVDNMTFEKLLLKYGVAVNPENGYVETFEVEPEESFSHEEEDVEIEVFTDEEDWGW